MKTKNMLYKVFLFLSLLSLFSFQTTAFAADITGTAEITGSAVYGGQLTASVTEGPGEPYHYQWMREATTVGTDSSTYDIVEADIGYSISVIITHDGYDGSLNASSEVVEKADCEVTPIVAPVLLSKTDTTISVEIVADYEYIIVADGITELPDNQWQDSNEFASLTPNTQYDIYQRVKATTTHKASVASDKLDESTDPPPISGTAVITGDAVYGNQLTASVDSGEANTGTLYYQWFREEDAIAAPSETATYDIVEVDIGNRIKVEITSSVETGTLTSTQTAAVQKADSTPLKGITPVLESATDTSLTVSSVLGYEYKIVADDADPLSVGTWQGSNEFTGLTAYTAYDIYQRVKETATHKESEISDKLDALTDAEALTGTVTISGNAVYGQQLNSQVNIDNNTGTLQYQWMRGSTDIEGATGENYTLAEADIGEQIKLKITSTVETGEVLSAATAEVQKADCEVTPIVAPVLSSKTAVSVTVNAVSGYEYKIVANDADPSSTGNWQDSNVFTGLASNTAYDIYQRVKTTSTHKESAISGKLDVTTEIGALTGTAEITIKNTTDTIPQFDDTLVAALNNGNNTGTLSYQWVRGSTDIASATGSEYKLGLNDIGEKISVKITSSAETGTLTSAQTPTVEKADCIVSVGETPVLYSKTSSTITLVNKLGYEYKIVPNGASHTTGTWQASNVFSGLSAATLYDFYQRVTETATQKPSDVSPKLDVTTGGTSLTGTASITGTATYGQTLTASLTASNNTGTLSYQWVRGTSDIPSATSSTYVLGALDVGQTIKVKIASSVEAGVVTSAQTGTVQKTNSSVSKGILPVLSDRSRHTITLTARTGYEYLLVRSGYSYTTGTWQASNVFTDLTSDTSYDAYQRVKETSTSKASAVSDKLDVRTRAYSSSSSSSTATPTPSPSPSATATPTPIPTIAPTPSATPSPTASPVPVRTTVTPAKINEDKSTGTLTVEIKISDLPQGTKSIKTSDDKIIEVSGTDTVYVTVNKEDINEDGTIELITLDEEGVALGYMAIDASEAVNGSEKGGSSAFLWIIIGLGAILVFTGVIYIIGRVRMRGRHGY